MQRLCVFISIIILPALVNSAVPGSMIGNVPDNNQPPANAQAAYCLPMSAVNIIEYWDTVQKRAGAYGVLGGLSGYKAAADIAWFCATNGGGSSSRDNASRGLTGTLRQDIEPGLAEFFPWDTDLTYGYTNSQVLPNKLDTEWTVDMDYTEGFDHIKAEIDAGRPVILCFSNWDISPGDTLADVSLPEPVTWYTWNIPPANTPQIEDAPYEYWYLDVRAEPGHAVTGIGYLEQYDPDAGAPAPLDDWVIVRDNWSVTPQAVAVPWRYWNATVTLDPGGYGLDMPYSQNPVAIDGVIYSEEIDDCTSLQIPNSRSINCKAVEQQALYFSFTSAPPGATTELHFCFDRNNDDPFSPQSSDLCIRVNSNGSQSAHIGSSGSWTPQIPATGWDCYISTNPFWTVELLVDYSTLGVTAGQDDTLGFAVWEYSQDDLGWPSASSPDVPSSWGDVYSSDQFLPVSLTGFSARVEDQQVHLQWQTASEERNLGFEIQRSASGTAPIPVAFINGAGTTTRPQMYTYTDRPAGYGDFEYRLFQIDTDGKRTFLDSLTVAVSYPRKFILYPNRPNPFNSSTQFEFVLAHPADVQIDIYSALGRTVYSRDKRHYDAGRHRLTWQGRDRAGHAVPSGVYICRISSGSRRFKMMLVR
ncbi:MAG: FlgD immunoglobulin-like domain containing protein [candidate division KSB1 bacterium]|nr:FlgD immunoglobulin-like domain containing protein [candidate division KSB1 bacterium]